MTKISEIISVCILASFLTGCSQVLQNVNLDINEPDNSSQEEFNVVEKTLTFKEAKKQKNAAYLRTVLKNGRGENAQPIPERLALLSEFPKSDEPSAYKIGINDKPNVVKEYSTFGGITLFTSRFTKPSCSNSFSCFESIC